MKYRIIKKSNRTIKYPKYYVQKRWLGIWTYWLNKNKKPYECFTFKEAIELLDDMLKNLEKVDSTKEIMKVVTTVTVKRKKLKYKHI